MASGVREQRVQSIDDQPWRRLRIGSTRKAKREMRVRVLLLDGRRLEVTCDARTATVAHVLQAVTEAVGVGARRPLALAAPLCGELVFPPPQLRLHRLARMGPAAWAPAQGPSTPATSNRSRPLAPMGLTLLLRLWLVLPALPELSDACGRRLLFLEMRRRTAEGRLRGSPAQLRRVRALARLADTSRPRSHTPSPTRGGLCETTSAAGNVDPSSRRAEATFVAAVARLPLAGAHCLDAVWVRSGVVPRPVTLAVAADAFVVLPAPTATAALVVASSTATRDAAEEELLRVPWPHVRRLRHCARSLRVSLCAEADAAPRKLKFYLPHNKSMFLFHLASLHHQVYLKLQNQLTTILPSYDLQSLNSFKKRCSSDAVERGHIFEDDCYKENNMFHGINPRISQQTSCSKIDSEVTIQRCSHTADGAFVLKSHSTNSVENFNLLQETLSESLVEKFEEISFVDERMLLTVKMRKDSEGSLGLQVECGLDGGLYIQDSTQSNVNIQKGDRIVAVNGRSLMHLKYIEVLDIIKSTGSEVEFILSRCSKSNGCNKNHNSSNNS